MKKLLRPALAGLLLVVALRPAVADDDQRTDAEKAADQYLTSALAKMKELTDCDSPRERRKLGEEIGHLFARACHADPDCDTRFFERFDQGDEKDNTVLRAVLYSQFARGFCSCRNWDKSLANVDAAIKLETKMTPFFQRLKDEILRRKKEAEKGDKQG